MSIPFMQALKSKLAALGDECGFVAIAFVGSTTDNTDASADLDIVYVVNHFTSDDLARIAAAATSAAAEVGLAVPHQSFDRAPVLDLPTPSIQVIHHLICKLEECTQVTPLASFDRAARNIPIHGRQLKDLFPIRKLTSDMCLHAPFGLADCKRMVESDVVGGLRWETNDPATTLLLKPFRRKLANSSEKFLLSVYASIHSARNYVRCFRGLADSRAEELASFRRLSFSESALPHEILERRNALFAGESVSADEATRWCARTLRLLTDMQVALGRQVS